MSYADFLKSKQRVFVGNGFTADTLPLGLFDWQAHIVRWACLQGVAAIWADTGLGKTAMQLAWADAVVRHTQRRVLVLTPLAVGAQTEREAAKFGVNAAHMTTHALPDAPIVILNYERLGNGQVCRIPPTTLLGCRMRAAMSETVRLEFVVERHAVTSVVIYEVTGEDLEQLEKENLSVGEDFSFALAATAVAISFTITLATVTIPAGKTNDVFWIVMLGGYVAGLFFGIRWFRGRRKFMSVCKKIRERGGPLGEEGKVLAAETAETVTVAETTQAGRP